MRPGQPAFCDEFRRSHSLCFLSYNPFQNPQTSQICVHAGDGIYLLQTDLSVICLEAAHRPVFVVSVALLVGLTVGFPAAMLAMLWRNKARLTEADVVERYGVLYTQYRPERFFMALVWTTMTAASALGLMVLSGDPVAQALIVAVVLMTVLALLAFLRPFRYAWKDTFFAGVILVAVVAVVRQQQSKGVQTG